MKKKNLDIWLHSYSRNVEGTGVHMKEIAKELKETYGYEYSDVRDKMTFDTTISIVKKSKPFYTKVPLVGDKLGDWIGDDYKYTIKIRKRRWRSDL